MQTINNAIVLDYAKYKEIESTKHNVQYVDETGALIRIPMSLLLVLYKTAKNNYKKRYSDDWELFCEKTLLED